VPAPDFVARLRAHIGHDLLWLSIAAGVGPAGGQAWVNDAESLEVGWHPLDALPQLSHHALSLLAHATSGKAEAAFAFSGTDHLLER
jgi:hypothetical protein